ncbi:MAG: hypothetical protein GEU81_06140 [Nitriliruptorales bacterium]|nr:hypothetical protein [Nitriliruptorales bacterium]
MRSETAARELGEAPPAPPRRVPPHRNASRRLQVPRPAAQRPPAPPPVSQVAPRPWRRLPFPARRPVMLGAIVCVAIAAGALAAAWSGADDRLGTLTVDQLVVGDCFQDPLQEGQIEGTVTTVESVPCSQPHYAEVYATLAHPAEAGQTFIGGQAIHEFANEGCREAFEPATGRAYGEPRIDFATIVPTGRSWSNGDRMVTCWALPSDGEPFTGTILDSGE